MRIYHQARHDLRECLIQLSRILIGSGNDERCARFVDQDRVHFIYNSVIMLPLHIFFRPHDKIVAQIVKTEFIVRSIRNIGAIRIRTRYRF